MSIGVANVGEAVVENRYSRSSKFVTGWPLAITTLLLAIAIVDPAREILTQDDGWAYARSVEHLLATGRYALDQWSAANMPAQIYFAAGLAKVFGYSLTLLRLSTIGLCGVFLVSFWHLLRFCKAPTLTATALTIGMLASPLFFVLSFTFMSDVQFLGWLSLSLLLYVRSFERRSLPLALVGSVTAALAIGTRQFGLAIIVGIICAQLLASKDRRPSIAQLATALVLPVAAAIWQVKVGAATPNITQAYRLAEQSIFLSQPITLLLREAIWRAAIWLQYLAGFLLPVWPIVVGASFRQFRQNTTARNIRVSACVLLLMLLVAIGLRLDSHLTVRPTSAGHTPWPSLGIFWVLQTTWQSGLAQRLLDAVAFLNIVPMAWLAFSTVKRPRNVRMSAASALLGGTGLAMLGAIGIYVQFNDTYVVAIVPFALLALAAVLRSSGVNRQWIVASIVLSVSVVILLSVSTRRNYDYQQQAWAAADIRVRQGMSYASADGPRHWSEYHGAFDDWVSAGTPGIEPPPRTHRPGNDEFHDPFYAWMKARSR